MLLPLLPPPRLEFPIGPVLVLHSISSSGAAVAAALMVVIAAAAVAVVLLLLLLPLIVVAFTVHGAATCAKQSKAEGHKGP